MSNDRKDRNDKKVLGNIVKSERFDQFYAKCFANGIDFNSDQSNAIKAEFVSADGEIQQLRAKVAELEAAQVVTVKEFAEVESIRQSSSQLTRELLKSGKRVLCWVGSLSDEYAHEGKHTKEIIEYDPEREIFFDTDADYWSFAVPVPRSYLDGLAWEHQA